MYWWVAIRRSCGRNYRTFSRERLRRELCRRFGMGKQAGESQTFSLVSGRKGKLRSEWLPKAVSSSMTIKAQGDQVLLRIVAGFTAKFFVVDLQVGHRAAKLTPPTVPIQDLLVQPFVGRRVQQQGSDLRTKHAHDAFSRRFSRN